MLYQIKLTMNGIRTDWIGSYKYKHHTITTTAAPKKFKKKKEKEKKKTLQGIVHLICKLISDVLEI